MRPSACRNLWSLVHALALGLALVPVARAVDFDREIRPILSDNCFACHGPDEKARKAGLRLDLKDQALKPLKDGRQAIVPGAPDRSSLITRIYTDDEDDLMPPRSTHKQLSDTQKTALRTWIADGAPWPQHWAFVPPSRPAPPQTRDKAWPRNDLDKFVAARLEKEGLIPSPRAPKTTLARRASLDLAGLPPTLEEMDAFLADKSPDAYEKLVDRLLASPRYGENMARTWLDAVRYADSHGYHIDSQRDIWAYRDWLINAFNQNQPFDQFTKEQLAGDLLPEATPSQKVATGYIRSNMSTGEGGAIEAEYASKYAFDRVETTGTAWLGLTLICARCHTHKYDPITQREYYGMYALFNQLDEPVMDGNKPNPDPFLKLPTPEQGERLSWLKDQITAGVRRVEAPDPLLDAAQDEWTSRWHARLAGGWSALTPTRAESPPETAGQLTVGDDSTVIASGVTAGTNRFELQLKPAQGQLAGVRLDVLPEPSPTSQPEQASPATTRHVLSELEVELVRKGPDAKPEKLSFVRALATAQEEEKGADRAIDGKPDTGWSITGEAGRRPQAALFLLATPLAVPEGAELQARLRFETDKSSPAFRRFRLSAAEDEEFVARLAPLRLEPWQLIGPFKTAGLKPGFDQAYPPETELDLRKSYPGVREEIRWHERGDLADGGDHLLVNDLHGVHGAYYLTRKIHVREPVQLDLALRADDLFKVWVNDRLVAESAEPHRYPGVKTRFGVQLRPGENRILVKLVNHQGSKYFSFNSAIGGPDVLAADVAAMLSVAGPWPDPNSKRVREYFRRQHDAAFRKSMDDIASWREEQAAIDAAIPTTLVAKERAEPRETVMLLRGEYDKPGDKVAPGVPAVLPPWPAAAPTNRLGLALWLLRPDHPLTARVTMNRLWQQFFGTGLVKTADDFGVQGERPSHPELLDWLATEFIASGWDLKHMARLIATSSTYCQSSATTGELVARDPENRLLARGPRFRADAEVLRDGALQISGLLAEEIGGPSVKPYEPPGLWEAVSFNNSQKYVPDKGRAQYRRTLYTFWKRQSPPPNLLLFDAPTREYCVVKRPRTNTPLQALALLNDPQFVEASRALAVRMLTEGGSRRAEQIAYGFRLATGRKPRREEIEILQGVLREQLREYRAAPSAAQALLDVGDFKAPTSLDPSELAAWSTIASMILNLDETVTKG